MKNVAKCDTWCELQNPVNHRVFERKLRPKPSGRGHVCLGVTHRVAPPHAAPILWVVAMSRGGYWPPVRLSRAAGLNASPRRRTSRQVVVETQLSSCAAAPAVARAPPRPFLRLGAPTATPGQAGLPAEFKHINKRRKRNLQGFP